MFHVPEYALNPGRLLLRAGFRILFYWPGLVLATLVLLYLLMSPGNEGNMTLDHGTFYGTLLALWHSGRIWSSSVSRQKSPRSVIAAGQSEGKR